ncbi:MAG: GFA family protein [Hyphomonadaceae bacterium]|nr:GFA family protein [Hyphomonadaceae bacterium]
MSAIGRCLCGAVEIEIGVPARWAWHDHAKKSRLAHGSAYATYVGCWRSRFRIVKGEKALRSYEDREARAVRRFCGTCGTPIAYERASSPQMVNCPRALFETRTGREPRYHANIDELQEWTYMGERLSPLKGFPGIVWDAGRKKKAVEIEHDVL